MIQKVFLQASVFFHFMNFVTLLIIEKDYCGFEHFNPSCTQKDEVLVMQKAVYGLMEKGRCVKNFLDYLGCSTNLLHYMDEQCSGLTECDVGLYRKEIKDKFSTPCPEPYLEASYICQKVIPSPDKCTKAHEIEVRTGRQFIASTTSKQSNCGFAHTPYILSAKHGQQINLTLADFSWNNMQIVSGESKNKCPVMYGHIITLEGDIVDICGGSSRISHIYTSSSHQVQVILQEGLPDNVKFLLTFEGLGCPDYIPPKNTWMKKDKNGIVIECQSTSRSWRLKCVGNYWIGVIGNCSLGPVFPEVSQKITDKNEFNSHHVSAIGISCLAIIVCCVTITIGVYCIRRYRVDEKSKNASELLLMTDNQPTTTLPSSRTAAPNTAAGTINSQHVVLPQHTGSGTVDRSGTESVQYFVLERPPGYIHCGQ